MPQPYKAYLGDGVYADFDGYALLLTTENGVTVTNTIYLEPDVIGGFQRYVTWLQERLEEEAAAPCPGCGQRPTASGCGCDKEGEQ